MNWKFPTLNTDGRAMKHVCFHIQLISNHILYQFLLIFSGRSQ